VGNRWWLAAGYVVHRCGAASQPRDDQRAMVAEDARERRSKLRMRERSVQARAAVEARYPVKRDGEVNVSSSSAPTQPRTREAVAREHKIPERKLRAAAEVKHRAIKFCGRAQPALDQIYAGL
jgi:hypothetical protein